MLVRGSGHLLWAQWGLWASLHRSPTCPTHGSGTRPRSTRLGSGSGLCAGRRGRRGGTCSAAGSQLRSALGGTLQGRGDGRGSHFLGRDSGAPAPPTLPAPRASDPTSLQRRGGGTGPTAGPRSHRRTMLPPTREPSPATEERAGPGPLGGRPGSHRPPAPTDPRRPLLASACPALTLLTGQAGPALGAGAVARDGVTGAPVLAEAGLPAALAMQALGAGWETERAARCSTRQPGPQGPRAPLGRASAKTSVGPGSETSPRTTSPRPPGPTSPAVLGTMHHLPGPRPSPRQVLHPPRVPGDPAGPSEGGAHPSREVGMAYPAGSWGLSSQGHSNTVHGLGHRRPHGSRCKPGCSCAHR